MNRTTLSELPLFAGLEASQLERIEPFSGTVRFEAGQLIFREGDEARLLYVIQHGRVALQMHAPGRGASTVQTLRDGEILGLSWLYPPHHWMFDARAIEPTDLVVIDAGRLLEVCGADNGLGYLLMTRLVRAFGERLQAARIQLLDLYGSHG